MCRSSVSCAVFTVLNFALLCSASPNCPADTVDRIWIYDGNSSCSTIIRSRNTDATGPFTFCSSPATGLGPDGRITTLRSLAHAAALGALIAPEQAWVGLRGGSAWIWEDPSSSYGLASAAPWVNGIPSPSGAAQCVTIASTTGYIKEQECGNWDNNLIAAVACSIPATCTAGCSANSTDSGALRRLRVDSVQTFDAQQLRVERGNSGVVVQNDASSAAGCGSSWPSPQSVDAWLGNMSWLPGTVLRVCSRDGSLSPTLSSPTPISVALAGLVVTGSSCPGTGLNLSMCQDLYLPPAVTRTSRARQVLSLDGWDLSCAITEPGGVVQCWGDGTSFDEPLSERAMALATGFGHGCLITAASMRVLCWGFLPSSALPPDEPTGSVVVCGDSHNCIINHDAWSAVDGSDRPGRVQCWGGNEYGESAVPADVDEVSDLAAGGYSTCAVLHGSGKVRCWGKSSEGLTDVPSDLPPATRVTMSANNACAILRGTGRVRCWGLGLFGSTATPAALDSYPAADVCTGDDHTCVLLAGSGLVYCWGADFFDQVPAPADLLPSSAITCGRTHTCAVEAESGNVVCWGYGQVRSPGFRVAAWQATSTPVFFRNASSDESSYEIAGRIMHREWSLLELKWAASGSGYQNGTVAAGGSSALVTYRPAGGAAQWAVLPGRPGGVGPQVPDVVVYTQAAAWGTGVTASCSSLRGTVFHPDLVAALPVDDELVAFTCTTEAFAYGASTTELTPATYEISHWPQRPARLVHTAAVSPSDETRFVPAPSLNMSALRQSLHDALLLSAGTLKGSLGSPVVLPVRAGDEVHVHGQGFGMHAFNVPSVPWWFSPVNSTVRSCVHLSWWASPQAFHNDSDCTCNGLEDWLGEGELPLSAITAWNDTLITFTAPLGEGVREVRPCVEGQGLTPERRPRSSTSIFLAWEPPRILEVLPSAFSDTTDFEAAVSLRLANIAVVPTSVSDALPGAWGRCQAGSSLVQRANASANDRVYVLPQVPSEQAWHLLRHCTAVPFVVSSAAGCFSAVSSSNASEAFGRVCSPSLTAATPESQVAISAAADGASLKSLASGTQVVLVPMPAAVPAAALQVFFRAGVWDGGLELQAEAEESATSFTRTLPLLRSVTPNILLLGRENAGGNESGVGVVQLRLNGQGFRTVEDLRDPANGAGAVSTEVRVWLGEDEVPCGSPTVVREEFGSTHVTCEYPAQRLSGGQHQVKLLMMGVNTTLPSTALTVRCAAGFHGLFGAGHQLCLPCPVGGVCEEGAARPPVAAASFYSLGLPPLEGTVNSSAAEGVQGISALTDAVCPPDVLASVGLRPVACVVACDPPSACAGGNRCEEGYISKAPLYRCAECASGYYRSSGLCVQCPPLGAAALAVWLLAALAASALWYLMAALDFRLCTLNIVLEYAQIVSLLSGPNLPWPDSVTAVLHALSILRANIEVASPECYSTMFFAVTPQARLQAVVVAPLVVLLGSAVAYLVMRWTKQLLRRCHRISANPSPAAAVEGARAVSEAASDSAGAQVDINPIRQHSGSAESSPAPQMGKVTPSPSPPDDSYVGSHGPVVCRTALKLLGMLYLPIVQTSLEVFNCTATEPSDGKLYLSIVFEECGRPGGLQDVMTPWSVLGLALFGVGYPLLLLLFFRRYDELIVEDQLLRAAEVGDDAETNPRAHWLRLYAGPLYEDYRPGHHYSALAAHGRRALVCICALMLNKSAVLVSASVVVVMAVSLTALASMRPLMSPTTGFASACALLSAASSSPAALKAAGNSMEQRLQLRIKDIAVRTRVPSLVRLAAGKAPPSAETGWTSWVLDWNNLESQLHMHIILIGQLSVMYNAALESAYESTAVAAVTVLFFLLQLAAACHICVATSCEVTLQLQDVLSHLLSSKETTEGAGHVMDEDIRAEVRRIHPCHLLYVCCFPRAASRARFRSLLNTSVNGVKAPAQGYEGHTEAVVAEWTGNPIANPAWSGATKPKISIPPSGHERAFVHQVASSSTGNAMIVRRDQHACVDVILSEGFSGDLSTTARAARDTGEKLDVITGTEEMLDVITGTEETLVVDGITGIAVQESSAAAVGWAEREQGTEGDPVRSPSRRERALALAGLAAANVPQ